MKQIKTYHQLCIFIFLIALSYQAFQKTIIVTDYFINTDNYIANCINKAVPEMHCNGKCQMENKLEETDSNDFQKPVKNTPQILEIILYVDALDTYNYIYIESNSKRFYRSQPSKTADRPHPIFRPPIV